MARNKSQTVSAAYIVGIIKEARVIEERLTVQDPSEVRLSGMSRQIRTQTTSTFELGVAEDLPVKAFQVSLSFSAILSLDGTSEFSSYACKFVATFGIEERGGFEDWGNIPPSAVTPYFAITHFLARQRAEERFLSAGFRGVVLPPLDISKGLSMQNTDQPGRSSETR